MMPLMRNMIHKMPMSSTTTNRFLSSQGKNALRKLQEVVHEYRLTNYTQETPSRMKKEIVSAAKNPRKDTVEIEGFNDVLSNIGVANKISREELQLIFQEMGSGTSGEIPADRMVKIL
mmetsp:Transcript_13800/g.19891  ORF Transcript_13800/g.19891 Transcript_13800/m.19891 type:complete len:118 (+) Transcript_13800:43-396(+)